MNLWPFRKPVERRASTDFTRSHVDAIIAAASADGVNVGETAAAAAASGLLARSFAAAMVKPSVERTGLDASTLHEIGGAFILSGESVFLIEVTDGMVMLTRASSWDIEGTAPATWRYLLELPGPSDHWTVRAPAAQVLHFRAYQSAALPHRGRSPLALSGASAESLANAESQLRDELSGPVGRLIPAPLDQLGDGDEDDPLATLEASLAALRGRSALVPSMSRDWGAGGPQNATDWKSQRIGADPPDSVVRLRKEGHEAVLAAAGVPPMLFSAAGQAQASREALRQFLHMTVAPLARIVEVEATRKLAAPVALDFTSLHASDVQGRARSFQSLVGGGMDVERAARLSGLLIDDGE